MAHRKSLRSNPAWCGVCGLLIPTDTACNQDDLFGSVDHIIPLANGGLNIMENRQPAHRYCNTKKGNRVTLPWDYVISLQWQIARKLTSRGHAIGPEKIAAARRRIGLTPPKVARKAGAPLMIQYWEDDGGAIAQW